MRSRLISCLILALLALGAGRVFAQSGNDSDLYAIGDVAVDITADSAAHARDQAVAEAQHSALKQLLDRLSADPNLAAKADDDTVATLVQNFEVENERSSAVRYIGTFTVQFRPAAVREWLSQNNAHFEETRSKPVVVLPILNTGGHPVLWEQPTKWQDAWQSAHGGGLVPVIVPTGGLEDIAAISTDEALGGNADALKALIDKYQADGAVVAELDSDPAAPGNELRIDVFRYDGDGKALGQPVHLSLPGASDKAAVDAALAEAVREVRRGLEGNWKQSLVRAAEAPPAQLAITVPIETLAEWESIKRRLDNVPSVENTRVVMLTHGTANIELEYRGTIDQLQSDLAQQQLALTQDNVNGTWILQVSTSDSAL
jgi:hypothetical protein